MLYSKIGSDIPLMDIREFARNLLEEHGDIEKDKQAYIKLLPIGVQRDLSDDKYARKELEERLRRVQPMINLVDNMVKLGSLYNTNGPADSHMTGNGKYI